MLVWQVWWPFHLELPFILFAVVTSKWNSDKKDKRTRDVQMKVEKILTSLLGRAKDPQWLKEYQKLEKDWKEVVEIIITNH